MISEFKLYTLPKGWIWSTIGEVCHEPQYGWTTSGSPEGMVYLLRTTDITSGNINWNSVPYCQKVPPQKEKYLLKDGDIVISRAGSVGFSHLIKHPREAVFASYLIRFRTLIEERYLSFYLKSPFYWDAISEKSIGIAIPNVNATKLRQIIIPIPPLAEQHRIVARIEELFSDLDAGVEALKKAKAQLKLYRQAVLKAAFEGRLTVAWREAHKGELEPASIILKKIREESGTASQARHKEFSIDISTPHSLPEKWEWVTLGELIDSMQNGIYKPREFYSSEGVACLRMYNIENGEIVWKDIKRMVLSEDEIKQYELEADDILINRVNSRELVGKAAVIPASLERCVYESKNIRMRLKIDYVKSKYINYWLRLFAQGYFNINAQQVVGMASINQQQISAMPIPFSHPSEQYQIIEDVEFRFSILDSIGKGIDKDLLQAERLRQAILQKAFTGRLVPQDPEDEPAEMLLERIKREKAGQAAGKKPSRRPAQRNLNYG